MLDMGFIHDIRRVLNILPQKKQSLLFSATFSDEIKALATTSVALTSFFAVSEVALSSVVVLVLFSLFGELQDTLNSKTKLAPINVNFPIPMFFIFIPFLI